MKEMSKVKVYQKKSITSIKNEQYLLSKLRHPFMINMLYSFQDPQNLYIILDYLPGGDLRFHLSRYKHFSEDISKFIVCNIILILDYLRNKGVIHRDVKPENLVFDVNGFIHLTDFGIAQETDSMVHNDTSGTPGYMAPEVLLNKPHTFTADYYAVGVIAYELLYGHRPYRGKSRKEIMDEMFSKEIKLNPDNMPQKWDPSACDFITRLLKRKPKERLGSRLGIKELKMHPWLIGVQWELMEKKEVETPYKPEIGDNFDQKYANKEDKATSQNGDYSEILYKLNSSKVFDGFDYNYFEDGINNKQLVDDTNNHSQKPFYHKKSFSTLSYNTGIDSDIGFDKTNM